MSHGVWRGLALDVASGNVHRGWQSGSGAGSLDGLDRIDWEGGPDYWTVAQNGAKMTNAEAMGWSDPTFFPIGCFLVKGDAPTVTALQAANVNTALCVQGVDSHITGLVAGGFSIVANYDTWFGDAVIDGETAVVAYGWDEPEFGIGDVVWMAQIDDARAEADGRFMWTNWGMAAIGFWGFDPNYADVVGVDQYTYTSAFVRGHFHTDIEPDWPGPTGDDAYTRKSASYGFQADRINQYQDVNGSGLNTAPRWIFFETQMPYLTEDEREIILYAEQKGAVWSALIHEARGIQWFDHNGFYHADEIGAGNPAEDYTYNGGLDPNTGLAPNEQTYSLVSGDAAMRANVAAINAQVLSLASVLNTQSYEFSFGASGIDTMLKGYGGFAYIFAGVALGGTTGSKTFTVTGSGITGTSVEVIDEARSLTIGGGSFSDTFSNEYSYHIYKVAI